MKNEKQWIFLTLFGICVVFSALTILNQLQTRSQAHAQTSLDSWLSSFTNFLFPYQESPKSLKLSTFYPPTPTITPTFPPGQPTYTPAPTYAPGQPTPTGGWSTPVPTIPGGGPPVSGAQYCVDEEPTSVMIEACDDETRCDIAHGNGGPSSTCGKVISWTHPIIESLLTITGSQYNRRLTDNFAAAIASSCHTATPWQPYISTFTVIDSYRLAGFPGFERGTHADTTALTNAWKSTAGYTTTTNVNGVTPGDAALFSNPPHAGIVNTVEVDANGNGSLWVLHSGAAYYLAKLFVANWAVVESSTGDTAVTFGSHTSKGPDDTHGSTICYCGSICYEWHFKP